MATTRSTICRFLNWIVFFSFLFASCKIAVAQSYPIRPVKIVVPFSQGSTSDIFVRQISEALSRSLGQTFIVENAINRSVNANFVSFDLTKAPADGYTLMVITSTHTAAEALSYDKQFRLQRDAIPVAGINYSDLVMVIPSSLQARTVGEFIELAKRSPRGLSYASSGPGSPYHMAGELFKIITGTDLVHIPYRSAASARADLAAGQVHLMFDTVGPVLPLIRDGQLRALGTSGPNPVPALPQVAPLREAGLEGLNVVLWTGIVAPRGTPIGVIETLNSAINRILDQPDIRSTWAEQGATPLRLTSLAFGEFIQSDVKKWGVLAQRGSVRLD